MPVFKLPLSGDVVQSINPFTAFMSPMGSQVGLVNITIGQSSAPEIEQDILSDVGSYGKQIGQIADALLVVIEHMSHRPSLNAKEQDAIDAFKTMLHGIADVKQHHKRPALRPRPE